MFKFASSRLFKTLIGVMFFTYFTITENRAAGTRKMGYRDIRKCNIEIYGSAIKTTTKTVLSFLQQTFIKILKFDC